MRHLIGALVPLLLATPAHAQSVVVIVGDAPSPAELRAAVIETIAERGVRLVRTPDGDACGEDIVECAADLAARTGADATLWISVEIGETSRVRVHLVPAEGTPVEVTEDVADADFASAAAAAVVSVLSMTREDAGFILVRSTPRGADVSIDGEPIGHTPVRHTVAPGEHTVRIDDAAGTHEETVTVRSNEETSIERDLSRSGDTSESRGARPERTTRSEASPFNWLIGGALAVAGVATLISPLSSLAREGECVEAIEHVGCVEQVHFGEQSGILLGVGLAALVAAVIFDAISPIRVDVEVSAGGAAASLMGRF